MFIRPHGPISNRMLGTLQLLPSAVQGAMQPLWRRQAPTVVLQQIIKINCESWGYRGNSRDTMGIYGIPTGKSPEEWQLVFYGDS